MCEKELVPLMRKENFEKESPEYEDLTLRLC